jgi:uncharacterized protein (DUF952 family)
LTRRNWAKPCASRPSRDGALFPHLYGALPLEHVVWVKPLTRGADGVFVLPELGE